MNCIMVAETNTPFTKAVKSVIKRIPKGKVASYGQIAAMAGNPRAARQVVRILHSSSRKDKLPWHRVINSKGTISLKPGRGYELQKSFLKKEGIKFGLDDTIDLNQFQWSPRSTTSGGGRV
jgi:methylated-DNA-protein-cysteine methyltransferase-like protein